MAYEREQHYSIFDWMIKNNLDPDHRLMKLAERLDWDGIIERLTKYYSSKGRRAKRIRMMAGLHILKHMHDLSDQEVVEGLKENLYWMVFCGVPTEQIGYGKPLKWLDSSTMTKFRKRVGAEGIEAIEAVLREQILSSQGRRPRVMLMDTTCMEKHIAYPTDAALLDKGRRKLVRIIQRLKAEGVTVTERIRSYARVGKKALCEINKFGRTSQEKIHKPLIRLARYAEDVVSHVPHVVRQAKKSLRRGAPRTLTNLSRELEQTAESVQKILTQTKARLLGVHVPRKLYSLHEPEVTCITKGKRSKPHEYGCKVSLTVCEKGFVLAHREYADNRHDSQTISEGLLDWRRITKELPEVLSMDRGFRCKEGREPESLAEIPRVVIPAVGKKKAPQERQWWFKKYRRMRSMIEAVISHLKQDHRMNRSRYRGFHGDRINASLAAIAWNAKKWALNAG